MKTPGIEENEKWILEWNDNEGSIATPAELKKIRLPEANKLPKTKHIKLVLEVKNGILLDVYSAKTRHQVENS